MLTVHILKSKFKKKMVVFLVSFLIKRIMLCVTHDTCRKQIIKRITCHALMKEQICLSLLMGGLNVVCLSIRKKLPSCPSVDKGLHVGSHWINNGHVGVSHMSKLPLNKLCRNMYGVKMKCYYYIRL
jgi:hypothetical protein